MLLMAGWAFIQKDIAMKFSLSLNVWVENLWSNTPISWDIQDITAQ